jgi:dihydrofolate reductase
MGKVVLAMSMSLDGFVAGLNISKNSPMGEGGLRLHDWLLSKTPHEIDAGIARDIHATTGAVILGKRTFEVGVDIWKDTPYAVPCFVLTHEVREKRVEKSEVFTFVNDEIESALSQTKKVAGDKNIMLMGASTAQQFLRAGLLEELRLQIVPILLGKGLRLFENLEGKTIELEKTRMLESPAVTHLWFRVKKSKGETL